MTVGYTNTVILRFGEPCLLTEDLRLDENDLDNEVLTLKDKEGRDILRMSFHTKDWVEWVPRATAVVAGDTQDLSRLLTRLMHNT